MYKLEETLDILKLIFEIRMTENGDQNFRNWLFGENSELNIKNGNVVEENFGDLRKVIVNNINVTDVYEATNEKYIYKNVVMCDGFSAHKYFIDDTFLFMKILYLVLNGILNLCYDAEHKIHFISSNTSIKEIANRKTWLSGSEYQIEHIYEYKKGNLLYKDLKIFTFSVGENISIKDILLYLINN